MIDDPRLSCDVTDPMDDVFIAVSVDVRVHTSVGEDDTGIEQQTDDVGKLVDDIRGRTDIQYNEDDVTSFSGVDIGER